MSRVLHQLRLLLALFGVLFALVGSTLAQANLASSDNHWRQSREDYQLARTVLQKNDFGAYLALQESLTDYPLYPYLQYQYLLKRLNKLSLQEVKHFTHQWKDTPLASKLEHRWLKHLAKQGHWQQFLNNYGDTNRSEELRCHALWAKHKTGNTVQALSEVPPLWLVGYSQHSACDAIFGLWVKKGFLTDDMAWQRFKLAIKAGNLSLARYLERFMSAKHQHTAKLYRSVYTHPHRLVERDQFDLNNPEHQDIVLHVFQRLARKDSIAAQKLWPAYSQNNHFSDHQRNQITEHIMLWLAHQDHSFNFQQLTKEQSSLVNEKIIDAGIKLAIRQQNWPLLADFAYKLPQAKQENPKVQYWLARAQLETQPQNKTIAEQRLLKLASQRDYYGFLAADYLQRPYQMNEQHYSLDGNFLERFKQASAIIRAQELRLVGQTADARREWHRETLGFTQEQHYTAAHHAKQIGWHSQAIRSAIAAKRWHDLELRFPVSFESSFEEKAYQHRLNSNWLIAMARQESALTPDAISHAGARGLIQIMPSTAKTVAHKHNIDYQSRTELLDPHKNIELASAYLNSLLEQFDNNKIYATAAYNAGPNRVKQWLQSTAGLPIDVWIESIPYHETRQYVKNVLTYSAIYAHRREHSNLQMATVDYLQRDGNKN